MVMQYFGYLRRDPDGSYLTWIQELNTSGDSRNMINGFVNSRSIASALAHFRLEILKQ